MLAHRGCALWRWWIAVARRGRQGGFAGGMVYWKLEMVLMWDVGRDRLEMICTVPDLLAQSTGPIGGFRIGTTMSPLLLELRIAVMHKVLL